MLEPLNVVVELVEIAAEGEPVCVPLYETNTLELPILLRDGLVLCVDDKLGEIVGETVLRPVLDAVEIIDIVIVPTGLTEALVAPLSLVVIETSAEGLLVNIDEDDKLGAFVEETVPNPVLDAVEIIDIVIVPTGLTEPVPISLPLVLIEKSAEGLPVNIDDSDTLVVEVDEAAVDIERLTERVCINVDITDGLVMALNDGEPLFDSVSTALFVSV